MSQLVLTATQYVPFDSKKNLNSGDTAWVLASAALVLLMTPGLAFFYGGMVRAKHILGMLIQNFAAIAIVSVTWILVGFCLAFGGEGKFLGDLHFLGMQHINDVVPDARVRAQTTPTLAFVAFQVTFAIITPALITGAAADRWKFGAFVAFVAVWSVVDLRPGRALGVRRLRLAEPIAATGRKVLRRRLRRRNRRPHQRRCRGPGHGARARQAPGLAAGEDARQQHPVRDARCRPAVVRLVRIQRRFRADARATSRPTPGSTRTPRPPPRCSAGSSWRSCVTGSPPRWAPHPAPWPGWSRSRPCAGFVSPIGSIFIGLFAGVVCAFAISLKNRFGFDDSLDVVGVHFVGGWIGTLCIGFFSTSGTNALANDGILYGGGGKYGGWNLLLHQFMAAGAVTIFSFVGTFDHRQGDRAVLPDPRQRGRGARWVSTSPSTASLPTTSARSAASVRAIRAGAGGTIRRRWTHEAHHRSHQAVQAR